MIRDLFAGNPNDFHFLWQWWLSVGQNIVFVILNQTKCFANNNAFENSKREKAMYTSLTHQVHVLLPQDAEPSQFSKKRAAYIYIYFTRLEPASWPTWKQWKVATRKAPHLWIPRWFSYSAPFTKKTCFLQIEEDFLAMTTVSVNKAGTNWKTLLPSPFHPLRASAAPSAKLGDDGVATAGEAAFGGDADADG